MAKLTSGGGDVRHFSLPDPGNMNAVLGHECGKKPIDSDKPRKDQPRHTVRLVYVMSCGCALRFAYKIAA
jgi:hypothetical protein